MHLKLLSPKRYAHTMFWALLLSALIVAVAATLARASFNVTAALTEKPDIAIYLLLKDEKVGTTTLLRDSRDERDYLAQTKDGPKLVRLKRGPNQWFVEFEEELKP
jgi:hypothetical protein